MIGPGSEYGAPNTPSPPNFSQYASNTLGQVLTSLLAEQSPVTSTILPAFGSLISGGGLKAPPKMQFLSANAKDRRGAIGKILSSYTFGLLGDQGGGQ